MIRLLQPATFDARRLHRFTLFRRLHTGSRFLGFIGLNPSTADETRLDPTVTRLLRRAEATGYDGLLVVNAFSLRSTDPAALKTHPRPNHPQNDAAILAVAAACATLLVGWGCHARLHDRHQQLCQLLRDHALVCYKVNRDGTPVHPLYQRRDAPFLPYPLP